MEKANDEAEILDDLGIMDNSTWRSEIIAKFRLVNHCNFKSLGLYLIHKIYRFLMKQKTISFVIFNLKNLMKILIYSGLLIMW